MKNRIHLVWLALVIGLLLPQLADAQRPYYRPQVHEFAVQLFSGNYAMGFNPNVDGGFDYPGSHFNALTLNPINGLRYKYHIDHQNAVRAGVFYRNGIYEMGNVYVFDTYRGSKFDIDLKIGFEREYNMRKLQFFGGVDAIVSLGQLDEKFTLKDDPTFPREASGNYRNIGAGAFVGIRYFVSQHLSLAIENEFYYTRTYSGPIDPEKFYLFPDDERGVNFASVYVSFHFKRMRKSCTCGKP